MAGTSGAEKRHLLTSVATDYGSSPSAIVPVTVVINDDDNDDDDDDNAKLLGSVHGKRGEGIQLAWKNVNTYKEHPRPKGWWKFWRFWQNNERPPRDHILKEVSGYLRSGTLLGVIGASGAGKSTLLNYLTARFHTANGDGPVTVNGVELGPEIRQISGYVKQDDLFFGKLTVKEHLVFRALLRMDSRLSDADRMARVDDVINELGLTSCQDSHIDVPESHKGISGGEKRRLAFATEILTDPPILLCDEPTSGLDAYMAENVITSLKNMAKKNNRAIICTIHQASSQIYDLFDQVMFLSEGNVVFFGTQKDAESFFDNCGYTCPPHFNPAEYYIRTLATVPGEEWASLERIDTISQKFTESQYGRGVIDKIDSYVAQGDLTPHEVVADLTGEANFSSSWCRQFRTLMWRNGLTFIRHPMVLRLRIIQPLILALLVGLLFHVHSMNQGAITNINGVLFFLITVTSYSNINGAISGIPEQLPMILREYVIGVYRTDTYFLTRSLVELPLHILMSTAFMAVCYFTITLYRSFQAFAVCTGILILVANIAVSFGMMIAYIAGTVSAGLAMSTPIVVILMVFGGFFISNGGQPLYMKIFRYISWFRYSYELMAVNQWENVHSIECYDSRRFKHLNMSSIPCFRDGRDVLAFLYFDKENVVENLIILFSLLVGFRIIAYIALLIRARCSRL